MKYFINLTAYIIIYRLIHSQQYELESPDRNIKIEITVDKQI